MVEVQEHVEEPEALKTPSEPAEAYEVAICALYPHRMLRQFVQVIVKAVVEQMSGDAETATQLKVRYNHRSSSS